MAKPPPSPITSVSSPTTPVFFTRISDRDLTEIELHSVESINDLYRTHPEYNHKGTRHCRAIYRLASKGTTEMCCSLLPIGYSRYNLHCLYGLFRQQTTSSSSCSLHHWKPPSQGQTSGLSDGASNDKSMAEDVPRPVDAHLVSMHRDSTNTIDATSYLLFLR